jgi:hypothetical protein
MFFQLQFVVQAVIGEIAQNMVYTYVRAFIQNPLSHASKFQYNVFGVRIQRVHGLHFQYSHPWCFGIAAFSGFA